MPVDVVPRLLLPLLLLRCMVWGIGQRMVMFLLVTWCRYMAMTSVALPPSQHQQQQPHQTKAAAAAAV
jgi:hypothetical protein